MTPSYHSLCGQACGVAGLFLLVTSCGLPPCLEGKIHIEVVELLPGNTCLWEMWPAESSFDVETTGNRGHSGDQCELQKLEYLSLPQGAAAEGSIVYGDATLQKGYPVGALSPLSFKSDQCVMSVSGELNVSQNYSDFAAALVGQADGDQNAFFLRLGYETIYDCPNYHFSLPKTQMSKACGNTYRVNVRRL